MFHFGEYIMAQENEIIDTFINITLPILHSSPTHENVLVKEDVIMENHDNKIFSSPNISPICDEYSLVNIRRYSH